MSGNPIGLESAAALGTIGGMTVLDAVTLETKMGIVISASLITTIRQWMDFATVTVRVAIETKRTTEMKGPRSPSWTTVTTVLV